MPRLSIESLGRPPERYRLDLAPPCENTGHRFETLADARAEERKRAKLIRSTCHAWPDADYVPDALRLADQLEASGAGTAEFESMASKVYMGRKRFNIGGHLWKLADAFESRTATIFHPEWVFTGEEFTSVDPRPLLNSFRSTLVRLGAGNVAGFLIATIHGEFDPRSHLFHLHFHLLVSLSMVPILDKLRRLPKYRSTRSPGDGNQFVRVKRQALSNLPHPLTYIFQSSFPSRWRGTIDGVERRSRNRGRIPEPFHTQQLLWLARWRLKDITLLMGMSVGRDGFNINRVLESDDR